MPPPVNPITVNRSDHHGHCGLLLDKLEFVELINADSLFLHKPHTPNYRKCS